MFEFVLIVVLNGEPKYAGNIASCDLADEYVKVHYKQAEETRCLHKDFINLPKDLKMKDIYLQFD